MEIEKGLFDELYARYNRREFIHPDPLEFLYQYEEIRDREIAGLIASSLAYGRVSQILKSVIFVLKRMQPSPRTFLDNASQKSILQTFSGFKHRFTSSQNLASMLFGVKGILQRFDSLNACFIEGLNDTDDTVLPAISSFVQELTLHDKRNNSGFLPCPMKGSACKRLNLFLRWMVRKDDVDPGGWENVPPSKLVVPLDTHMHSISRALTLTKRKQADLRAALEITAAFRVISPQDPVKFDFAVTRLGIRKETDLDTFLKQWKLPEDRLHI